MKKKLQILGLMAVLAAFTISAMAFTGNSWFNRDDGGYVHKTEIMHLYGYNNPDFQAIADSVVFTYDIEGRILADCVWYTGKNQNIREHTVTFRWNFPVNRRAHVVSDTERVNGNGTRVLGYYLDGVSLSGRGLPEAGQPCATGQGKKNGTYQNIRGNYTEALYANGPQLNLPSQPQ